ncbi:MAG: lytic murein transglycosylase, partial [Rhodobacteraceae bacterium]|nr:lytic murein transglycosylase [Paracoccaceae bacterium]
MRALVLALVVSLSLAAPSASAQSAPCGGDFGAFVNGLRQEALSRGLPPASVDSFFRGVARDPAVISRDRGQGVFRLPFTEFARRVISQNRMVNGNRNAERHAAILARAEREFGIPQAILLAFWALETDFGAVQGDFNTRNALVTLAHDCRRPGLFRPHIFAAIALHARGDFDPATMTGAWAGEIGMVQKLPLDILELGVDGDGDGRIDLKNSVPDALLSAANMLRARGWRAGQPWLVEVSVPDRMDWSRSGTDTRLPVSDWQGMGVRAR